MWRFGRQQPAPSQPQSDEGKPQGTEEPAAAAVAETGLEPPPAAPGQQGPPQEDADGEIGGAQVVRRTRLEQVFSHFLHALPVRRLHDLILGPSALSCATPLWLLGVRYHAEPGAGESDDIACAEFLRDFQSRLWFTYRKDFEPLGEAGLTSDVGWGCMLRSGQMLLAQAIVCQRLGRAWRCGADGSGGEEAHRLYHLILSRFADTFAASSPFSVHNLIRAGRAHGLAEGAWLGPYALCRTLEALARTPGAARDALGMAVYVVAADADGQRGGAPVLSVADVARACDQYAAAAAASSPPVHTQSGREGPVPQDASGQLDLPVLILVPLVLGVESVNPRYLPSLRAVFEFPYSVGVLGGKPGASTYLVGVQDDSAFYLDPHEVQPVSSEDPSPQTSSYHCSVVRKMPLNAIDSSIALGFYCQTRDELEDLCRKADKLAEESNGAPMFTVAPSEAQHSKELPSGTFGTTLELCDEGLLSRDSSNSPRTAKLQEEGDWQLV